MKARSSNRTRSLVVVSLLVGACAASMASGPLPPHAHAAPAPDVVVIMSDDQRWDTFQKMPNVRGSVIDAGVRYPNAMVPTSICCPSRVSTLTGRFAHSTGVWTGEEGPGGGWPTFVEIGGEESNLATWLHGVGYRTALIGKYLNGYKQAPAEHVAPGWDVWQPFVQPAYFDYFMKDGDASAQFGSAPGDYSTDVIASRADEFIRQTPDGEPLFAFITPYGVHAPRIPADRHLGSCSNEKLVHPPSYNEADVSDKPKWLQHVPRLTEARRTSIDGWMRSTCETLRSVDDLVGTVVEALRDTGRLDHTLLIYMSDNGFLWGEHRLIGKWQGYDAATRIPMAVRFDPSLDAGTVDRRPALNVDVAATIAELTGIEPATPVEGISLLAPPRDGFVLEATRRTRMYPYSRPSYCGWRTRTSSFVHYANGEEEFYTLRTDPYELENKIDRPSLRTRIVEMRKKARAACKPRPPGFGWKT